MGKGQGKKGRKEAKLAAKFLNQEPKIPGLLKPEKLAKKATATAALPLGQQPPLTKKLQHAKWPALFKRHLGVIESHVKNLDRVMQSTKSEMDRMDEKDRLEWELGERGNWRVICEMIDRAREVLVSARKAAQGILPEGYLRDKKGLGVSGLTFEPLGPKLAARAAELGFIGDPNKGLGRDIHVVADAGATDSDGDSEMTDSNSSSFPDDNVVPGADFVPPNIDKKPQAATAEDGDKDPKETSTSGVEPNPYFIIDTKPTPMVLNGNGPEKKSKKRRKEEAQEERKFKKAKKEKKTESQPEDPASVEPEVDFAALEAKLQAEVAAGEKAQEEQAQAESTSPEEKKSKKKRRRSSNGDEEVVKKKAKKEKRDKKEKKRKVDGDADGEEVDGSKKKKRKHHVDDPE